ncbi:uncharacterized protein [Primulina eburnea]|uniref:uncharacterized protein isoform X2 n=1 Tax=Primulina eburnea TaxID=1245227 RepID=UPI003C6C878B
MENFQTMCKEGEASVDEEERDEITSIMEGVEGEDYIQTLLDRELASDGIQVPESGGDWILQCRLGGIHYILEKREFLGLRFQTAYLSAAYLDGFLSRKPIAILNFTDYETMDDQVALIGVPFACGEDGGIHSDTIVGVSLERFQFREQTCTEDGTFGVEYIGLEDGIGHSLGIHSFLCQEIVWKQFKKWDFKNCRTHFTRNKKRGNNVSQAFCDRRISHVDCIGQWTDKSRTGAQDQPFNFKWCS